MKFLIVLAVLAISQAAHAFPKAPFNALEVTNDHSDKSEMASQYDFEGIIKLSNCSGSLVRFAGQPTSSKAVVLTNGHCHQAGAFGGMIKPGAVIVNKAFSRDMKIFNKEMKLFPVKVSKVMYATMTDTDISLYELTESYDSIMSKYKIEAFSMDTIKPFVGTNIDIVSGYWDRGYSCAIDAFIFQLKEENYLFQDSIRYTDTCDTVGGTSGSPIISRGTRNVIGINNTANESGRKCTMNNPCEITQEGKITVLRDKKYGQQTYTIYSCLRPDFNVDLTIPGCLLPKPKV